MKLWLGVLALVLNLAGYIPYYRDILRHKVRPQRITWGIWSILTIIVAVNQVKNGGGYSSLFFISATMLVLVTFLLSLKFGMGGASRLDKLCLVLALGLMIYWVGLRDYRLSTLIAVTIDGLGAAPTVVKTYHHPETENYIAWAAAAAGGFLSLFAIPKMFWILIIYPVYVIVMNCTIVAVKYVRDKQLHVATLKNAQADKIA